jgi:hypothetical protein
MADFQHSNALFDEKCKFQNFIRFFRDLDSHHMTVLGLTGKPMTEFNLDLSQNFPLNSYRLDLQSKLT